MSGCLPGSAVYVGTTDFVFQNSQSVPFVSCRNHFKKQLACEWVVLVGCGFGDSFLLLHCFPYAHAAKFLFVKEVQRRKK